MSVGSQGASFAAETLSAANDASSGNGEASSWPEVRHIRTYTLGHPLSVHKYVRRVWRPRLCPFIFVFSWSSGFSSFLTRRGDSECWNRIMRKFYREGRILTGLIEKFDIRWNEGGEKSILLESFLSRLRRDSEGEIYEFGIVEKKIGRTGMFGVNTI